VNQFSARVMGPNNLRAVFFDIDGVLLDSLPQHLRFCADKAREYGLFKLEMPSVESFRRMVSRGTSASPMLNFFLAVAFPAAQARRGVQDYQHQFMPRYRPDKFRGVDAMLERLTAAGLLLGLVTANIRANVEPALSDTMRYFDHRSLYFFDRYPEPKAKTWCLTEGARILKLTPEQCVYIGDQPADAVAASAAGLSFLGVSYGWSLPPDDPPFPIVDSVSAIADELLAAMAPKC
jgi:phosphoglycolate phosphatase-like HAD superfamily hydrolase